MSDREVRPPTPRRSALVLILCASLSALMPTLRAGAQEPPAPAARAQEPVLAHPGFHHLHLNTTNRAAALVFYAAQFPSTVPVIFAGEPALRAPNQVLILFQQVRTPPPTQPQSAFWHFGWHVTNTMASRDRYRRSGVEMCPLYTGDPGDTVFSSGETWPVGLTLDGIAKAKMTGARPSGGPGFGYIRGPDGALIEYQGDMRTERFNHVHMYQDQPLCAQLWYQQHLLVPGPSRTALSQDNCRAQRGGDKTFPALRYDGMYRSPVVNSLHFGDVFLYTFMKQDDAPLASSRGQLVDHIALSVTHLDAWIVKLQAEGVTFLEQPYDLGGQRAVMIEGPSREAIELVEVPDATM